MKQFMEQMCLTILEAAGLVQAVVAGLLAVAALRCALLGLLIILSFQNLREIRAVHLSIART